MAVGGSTVGVSIRDHPSAVQTKIYSGLLGVKQQTGYLGLLACSASHENGLRGGPVRKNHFLERQRFSSLRVVELIFVFDVASSVWSCQTTRDN